ncbi:MAG TPA: hypothetical protein VEM35_11210 [Rhizomicrobium sp.]|nr:hypothetical protein [Rhizomicrobium sp.]
MGRGNRIGLVCAGLLMSIVPAWAAEVPATAVDAPTVPPAKPGVFSQQKRSAIRYHLVVAGHKFTSRDAIEKYLLYRAAELALEQKAGWFTLIESRSKGDTVPAPKPDPAGLRYSFRVAYWRPVWRYKTSGAPGWKGWSPFSSVAFFDGDPKSVTDFEASADIVLRKGPMNDADPLAFEAGAVSDFLVNQVSPPE